MLWILLGESNKKSLLFEHPYFTATMIYIGEYLCLALSLASNDKGVPLTKIPMPLIKYWLLSLLSIASLFMQILCSNWKLGAVFNPYIGASLVLITILTSIRTRNQIPRHHNLGVVLVIVADVIFLGFMIINHKFNFLVCLITLASQAITELQVFIEEHYYKEYEISAIKCAGIEGMMCTSASVIAMPILQF